VKFFITVFLLVIFLVPASGCQNDAQTGALIGAGVGAAGGYIIGNERDKSRNHHGHYKRGHHNKRRHHHYNHY